MLRVQYEFDNLIILNVQPYFVYGLKNMAQLQGIFKAEGSKCLCFTSVLYLYPYYIARRGPLHYVSGPQAFSIYKREVIAPYCISLTLLCLCFSGLYQYSLK